MVGICSPFSIFIGLKRTKMDQKSKNEPLCIRCGDSYKCPVCKSEYLVENGKTQAGKQRYSCKECSKRFITEYT